MPENEQIDTAKEFEEEAKEFQQAEIVVQPQNQPQAVTIRDTDVTSFLDPNLYTQLKGLANDFIKSKAIPSVWTSAEQVLVGLQTGVEMGMKPMEAMNSLYPVNGAINVWGKATTRRVKEHGWTISYTDESQESCTATITRGDETYTDTFKFEDAVASGYTHKAGYNGQPDTLKIGWKEGMNRKKKLRYGVLSLLISTYIPEVLGSAIGIVEVSDDYDLGTNKNPAQLEETSSKVKSIAAAYKREENES